MFESSALEQVLELALHIARHITALPRIVNQRYQTLRVLHTIKFRSVGLFAVLIRNASASIMPD